MVLARWLTIVVLVLTGCGQGDERDAAPADSAAATPSTPQQPARDHLHPEFQRVPSEVLDVVQARRQYVGRFEVDPDWPLPATTEEIRRRLLDVQPRIGRMIAASERLEGTLPPAPQLSEEEISRDAHLETVRGRLVNNGRDVLLADAVRCWDDGDPTGCAERVAAALRIATYLLNQDDRQSRLRGAQVLVPAVLELKALTGNGLAGALEPDQRHGLSRLLRDAPTDRIISDMKGTEFDRALRVVRLVFSEA
jgi:hypothetical protein